MTTPPAPVRKSLLPCTPPPEWEFHTWFPLPDGGGDLVPGQRDRGVHIRRLVTYGDWEPVRPDRWADEPPTDAAPAVVPSVGRAAEEHRALKRAHVALAEQAGRDQAAVARVRRLHDALDAETGLTSPDQEITRGAAARKIAAALDGWTDPAELRRLAGEAAPDNTEAGHAGGEA